MTRISSVWVLGGLMMLAACGEVGDVPPGGDAGARPCTVSAQCSNLDYCDLSLGVCAPRLCSPSARLCVDGDVHVCNGDGSGSSVLVPCRGGEVCTGSAAPTCECEPDATRTCVDGDVYAVDSCGRRGALVSECQAGEVCAEDDQSASCVPGAPCAIDAECAVNSYCHLASGECRARVCTPGALSCQDGDVYQCASNGSGVTLMTECTDGATCTANPTPACTCAPLASKACSEGHVYHYDSCGVRGSRDDTCLATEVCAATIEGAECVLRTSCTDNSHCAATSFCDLDVGECRPDICTPFAASCSDGDVYSCNAAGSALTLSYECLDGRQCVMNPFPSCVCVSGATRRCYDGDIYNYDSCGTRQARYSDCQGPEVCTEASGTPTCALPPVCASDANCYPSSWCDVERGECMPDVCTIGTPYCSGQFVTNCSGNGSGTYVLDTCVGGEVCVMGGAGAVCQCTPNAYVGCYDTEIYNFNSCGQRGTVAMFCTHPEVCQLGAQGTPFCSTPITCAADSECATGDYCESGLCTPQLCTPTSQHCDGDSVLRCNARGSAYELYDSCVGGEVCDDSGLARCVCTANAYQGCNGGNVANFNSCGVATSVAQSCPLLSPCSLRPTGPECRSLTACDDDADCDADEYCELDACLPQLCVPSEAYCEGQTIRVCNANGSESVVLTDCGAGELCGESATGPRCGCEPDFAVGCDADGNVRTFDSCGQAGAVTQVCVAPLECVVTGVGATCSDPRSCGSSCVCASEGTVACMFGDVYEITTCNEPVALLEECEGSIFCNTIGGAPACRSSVASPAATYYTLSCPLVHQIEHPTTLVGDCRCSSNRVPSAGIPECVSAQYLDPAVAFGTGPRVRGLPQAHINGGFFDASARELIVGVDWSSATHPDSGLVMAVHVDSGNRRILSGAFQDGVNGYTQTGSGPSLHNVIDVQLGPDGSYYALSVPASSFELEIVRVDPGSGARTLAWRAGDVSFGQCPSGDPARTGVQVHDRGFAVDAAGAFYLGFTNTSPYGEGVGVVRIAASGASCEFVTRSGAQALNAYAGVDVGGGFHFDRGRYQGLLLHDGALYAVQHAYLSLVRIDLATGERTRVSSASTSTGVVGDGPTNASGIGQRWLTWDEDRQLMWASGTLNRRLLTAVELDDGRRTEAYCLDTNPERVWRDLCLGGALLAGYQNEGGLWVDSATGDLLVVHENYTLVRADIRNGNSIKFSL